MTAPRRLGAMFAWVAMTLWFMHGTAWGDAAAGGRLAAAKCVSCHASTATIHSTLPLLEGQPKAAFLAQWRDFRDGRRTAPVMVNLAQELTEREVDDLADYYAALTPAPRADAVGNEVGRALIDRLNCAGCHGAGLKGTDVGAARLAGQKARYTAWALQSMRAGTRAHGGAARPDPVLAPLSNAEIEAVAAHLASLR